MSTEPTEPAAHTPTPTPYRDVYSSGPDIMLHNADDLYFALVWGTEHGRRGETAAFIVRACNAHDELLAAAERLAFLFEQSGETANDRFERVGERFHEETGYLRPGKDQAAAMGGHPTDKERESAYYLWILELAAKVRAAIAKATEPSPQPTVESIGTEE